MKRSHLSKYCTFYENSTKDVIDTVIENCRKFGSDGILGHRTSLPVTSKSAQWWKRLKSTKQGREVQKMATTVLEKRQEHEDVVHSSIPKFWERLCSGFDAIAKFVEEQSSNLDDDMKNILRTDLEKETILYYFALAPIENKIPKSTWDDRWISIEKLTKKAIEESLKRMLRKPIDFDVSIPSESVSKETDHALLQIPGEREVVIWNLSTLYDKDVISAMVKEGMTLVTSTVLGDEFDINKIQSLRQISGVVLLCENEEQESHAKELKRQVDAVESAEKEPVDISGSDDDDVPLVEILKKRKTSDQQAEKPAKKIKSVSRGKRN